LSSGDIHEDLQAVVPSGQLRQLTSQSLSRVADWRQIGIDYPTVKASEIGYDLVDCSHASATVPAGRDMRTNQPSAPRWKFAISHPKQLLI
jgi:hypothetical protein